MPADPYSHLDSMTQLEAIEWVTSLVNETGVSAAEVDTVSWAEPSIALTLPTGQAATLRRNVLPD